MSGFQRLNLIRNCVRILNQNVKRINAGKTQEFVESESQLQLNRNQNFK